MRPRRRRAACILNDRHPITQIEALPHRALHNHVGERTRYYDVAVSRRCATACLAGFPGTPIRRSCEPFPRRAPGDSTNSTSADPADKASTSRGARPDFRRIRTSQDVECAPSMGPHDAHVDHQRSRRTCTVEHRLGCAKCLSRRGRVLPCDPVGKHDALLQIQQNECEGHGVVFAKRIERAASQWAGRNAQVLHDRGGARLFE